MPSIYSMVIVSKSGGLIYNKEFVSMPGHYQGGENDFLRLASMWHSLLAIAAQLSPVPGCRGIECLHADTFDTYCFQTLTAVKFLLFVAPGTPEAEALLQDTIYDLYCDYVLKNPFYEVEMPIRCELFDQHLGAAIAAVHRRWGVAQ